MVTTLVITALVSLLAGGGIGFGVSQKVGKHEVKVAEADARAMEAVAKAGSDAVSEAVAPMRDEIATLREYIEQSPPFCKEGELYDKYACLAHWTCNRGAATGDGGDAKQCDIALNLVVSLEMIETLKGAKSGEERLMMEKVFGQRK